MKLMCFVCMNMHMHTRLIRREAIKQECGSFSIVDYSIQSLLQYIDVQKHFKNHSFFIILTAFIIHLFITVIHI